MPAENGSVTHNESAKRFESKLGDSSAFLTYRLSAHAITFLHTEVPPEFEGRGIGGALVRAGLDYANQHGLKVIALCPFVAAYMQRHPPAM